jgi:ABC-type branched-subunit amino acid transport system substrate-binding protein
MRSVAALALTASACTAAISHAQPAPGNAIAADRMVARERGSERDRLVLRWAERATLPELIYLLRRTPAQLGALEAPLAEFALRRAGSNRAALRRRLTARIALADPKKTRKLIGELDPAVLRRLHPAASPFVISVLLPDTGQYKGYARSVRIGLEAGIATTNRSAALPLALSFRSSGGDDAGRTASELETAIDSSDAVVGELLSVPTLALATAARLEGFVLVSPTATDELVGTVGQSVFAIGPSGWARGEALARAMVESSRGVRVAALTSSSVERSAFARGFLETISGLGATVVDRDSYAPGTIAFKSTSEMIRAKRADILFWDGESREAEGLLRQLAQDKVSVRLCGGENLAPDRVRIESRPLLEGVRYVGEDWRLPSAAQATLDSMVRVRGGSAAQGLQTRGYLAARAIARAVGGGAMCAPEIAAELATHVARGPYLSRHHFLEPEDGARIPVWTVVRGRATLSGP